MLSLVALVLVAVAAEGIEWEYGYPPMQNPDLFEGDIIGVEGDLNGRNAISNAYLKWGGGRVPYVIDYSLSHATNMIRQAMDDYHRRTCIKFVPRTNEAHYIYIFSGEGCYSNVGRIGGRQQLSLGQGCLYVGTIVHELGHAIGFYHEQNRSDRDSYLVIYWQNIQQGMSSQFQKMNPSENWLITNFDYNSIMLYGSYAFSKDGRSITMKGTNGQMLQETYDKPGMSQADVTRVNTLYGCRL